jgi:hypothetical protein
VDIIRLTDQWSPPLISRGAASCADALVGLAQVLMPSSLLGIPAVQELKREMAA